MVFDCVEVFCIRVGNLLTTCCRISLANSFIFDPARSPVFPLYCRFHLERNTLLPHVQGLNGQKLQGVDAGYEHKGRLMAATKLMRVSVLTQNTQAEIKVMSKKKSRDGE